MEAASVSTKVCRTAAHSPHTGRVAVLMTVYAKDDAGHLAEALNSLRAQSHSDVRLYVFCDGPLPAANLRALEEQLQLQAGRDFLLFSEQRVGAAAGLNQIIEQALLDPDTQFIARMDADDLSMPTRFERQLAFLGNNPEVDVVGTWCIEFMKPGVPTFHKSVPVNHDEVMTFMCVRSPVVHPSVMIRRRVFDAGHRYDPQLSVMQDYDLWTRLAMAGIKISNVPEFLLWYRLGPDFFNRRAGWERALLEVRARAYYSTKMRLLRPWHPLAWLGLIGLRLAPTWVKRIAYNARRQFL
jgi:glycosyltransferase involved in cell wall biosynthesis